ncbi:MAG: metalloregulator ArsR/SmtB family transcription factor [Oligoflexia bacterium]|nr:metalloregulator ArsR/SmtB family transcription factor [Oligoflexia bacterium]
MKSPAIAKALAEQCEEISGTLKSLAHPTRLKILCHLIDGEKSVNEIITYCGGSQSGVSQFLARMKLERMVTSRREGQYIHYRIADPRILRLLKILKDLYC